MPNSNSVFFHHLCDWVNAGRNLAHKNLPSNAIRPFKNIPKVSSEVVGLKCSQLFNSTCLKKKISAEQTRIRRQTKRCCERFHQFHTQASTYELNKVAFSRQDDRAENHHCQLLLRHISHPMLRTINKHKHHNIRYPENLWGGNLIFKCQEDENADKNYTMHEIQKFKISPPDFQTSHARIRTTNLSTLERFSTIGQRVSLLT